MLSFSSTFFHQTTYVPWLSRSVAVTWRFLRAREKGGVVIFECRMQALGQEVSGFGDHLWGPTAKRISFCEAWERLVAGLTSQEDLTDQNLFNIIKKYPSLTTSSVGFAAGPNVQNSVIGAKAEFYERAYLLKAAQGQMEIHDARSPRSLAARFYRRLCVSIFDQIVFKELKEADVTKVLVAKVLEDDARYDSVYNFDAEVGWVKLCSSILAGQNIEISHPQNERIDMSSFTDQEVCHYTYPLAAGFPCVSVAFVKNETILEAIKLSPQDRSIASIFLQTF